MHIKEWVGITAFEPVITLKFRLSLSKFDNLRNMSNLFHIKQ